MRTIIRSGVMLIAMLILFSACSSGLSITKRRYTKGFYVHHAGKPAEVHASQRNENNARLSKNQPTQPGQYQRVAAPSPAAEQEALIASAAEKNTKQELKSNKSSTFEAVQEFVTRPVKKFHELKNEIKSNPASGEALSLLWILILVLLAAYIIGLLLDSFGLGWVIHLLLVVILVLIILWLLRIV